MLPDGLDSQARSRNSSDASSAARLKKLAVSGESQRRAPVATLKFARGKRVELVQHPRKPSSTRARRASVRSVRDAPKESRCRKAPSSHLYAEPARKSAPSERASRGMAPAHCATSSSDNARALVAGARHASGIEAHRVVKTHQARRDQPGAGPIARRNRPRQETARGARRFSRAAFQPAPGAEKPRSAAGNSPLAISTSSSGSHSRPAATAANAARSARR